MISVVFCYDRFMILILFITLFFLEIAAFVQVGGELGILKTILLIIITAILGLGRLRHYSFAMTRREGQSRKEVMDNLYHSIAGMIAGGLLLIPGFVTDSLGLLMLIPAVRSFLRMFMLNTVVSGSTFGFVDMDDLNDMKEHYDDKKTKKVKKSKGKVVEADFEVVDDDK